jgi:hypothetical protein
VRVRVRVRREDLLFTLTHTLEKRDTYADMYKNT